VCSRPFRARHRDSRIVALGETSSARRNVKELCLRREELTEDVGATRVKATVTRIDLLVKHQKKIAVLEEKTGPARAQASPATARHTRWLVAAKKCSSRALCANSSTRLFERKRLLDKGQQDRGHHAELERQIRSLEQKHEASKKRGTQEGIPASAEKLQGRSGKIESDAGVSILELKRTQREMIQATWMPSRPSAS